MCKFREDLVKLLDKHKIGQATGTHNAVIANYIESCITAWENTLKNTKLFGPIPKE